MRRQIGYRTRFGSALGGRRRRRRVRGRMGMGGKLCSGVWSRRGRAGLLCRLWVSAFRLRMPEEGRVGGGRVGSWGWSCWRVRSAGGRSDDAWGAGAGSGAACCLRRWCGRALPPRRFDLHSASPPKLGRGLRELTNECCDAALARINELQAPPSTHLRTRGIPADRSPPHAGAAIGLNAAIMSIITVWLSDLKLGYCTQGWWLNRKFCCWEMSELNDAGGCEDWQEWTSFVGVRWIFYVAFAVRTLSYRWV